MKHLLSISLIAIGGINAAQAGECKITLDTAVDFATAEGQITLPAQSIIECRDSAMSTYLDIASGKYRSGKGLDAAKVSAEFVGDTLKAVIDFHPWSAIPVGPNEMTEPGADIQNSHCVLRHKEDVTLSITDTRMTHLFETASNLRDCVALTFKEHMSETAQGFVHGSLAVYFREQEEGERLASHWVISPRYTNLHTFITKGCEKELGIR
jgi:hypothetical protein